MNANQDNRGAAVEKPAADRGNEKAARHGTVPGRIPTPAPPQDGDASSPGAEADRAQAKDRDQN
jgi:hypothetical protein